MLRLYDDDGADALGRPYDPIRIEAVDPSVLKQPRTFVACTLESVALCLLTYPSPSMLCVGCEARIDDYSTSD